MNAKTVFVPGVGLLGLSMASSRIIAAAYNRQYVFANRA
jgi:hypothetical protein